MIHGKTGTARDNRCTRAGCGAQPGDDCRTRAGKSLGDHCFHAERTIPIGTPVCPEHDGECDGKDPDCCCAAWHLVHGDAVTEGAYGAGSHR